MRGEGRVDGSGSKRQTYAASEPSASTSSTARRALFTVDSILPRCRTIDASWRSRSTSPSPKRATASKSKPANAALNASRFRRIVSHERPDWKPSSVSFSKSRRSSSTGKPHSASWYAR